MFTVRSPTLPYTVGVVQFGPAGGRPRVVRVHPRRSPSARARAHRRSDARYRRRSSGPRATTAERCNARRSRGLAASTVSTNWSACFRLPRPSARSPSESPPGTPWIRPTRQYPSAELLHQRQIAARVACEPREVFERRGDERLWPVSRRPGAGFRSSRPNTCCDSWRSCRNRRLGNLPLSIDDEQSDDEHRERVAAAAIGQRCRRMNFAAR